MDCRQRDQGPGHERAGEAVKVPAQRRAVFELSNYGRRQASQERRPNGPALQQPRDDDVFAHVTTAAPAARRSAKEQLGKTKVPPALQRVHLDRTQPSNAAVAEGVLLQTKFSPRGPQ